MSIDELALVYWGDGDAAAGEAAFAGDDAGVAGLAGDAAAAGDAPEVAGLTSTAGDAAAPAGAVIPSG